jgi:hypothetical protein
LRKLVEKVGITRISATKPVKPKRKQEGSVTCAEEFSAVPVHTNRDGYIQPERNINLRRCYWGCELCAGCKECVSNIDENGIDPVPDSEFCDADEGRERERAVLAVED